MNDNAKKLGRIPEILDIERVPLTKTLLQNLGTRAGDARKNEKHIFAYKFFYRSNKLRIRGFIVEPQTGGGKLPCVVYARGGTRDFGAIVPEKLFDGLIPTLARSGYIVIASQQSGGPECEGQDDQNGKNLQDIIKLFSILKKYPRADMSRVGIYGASRGGMSVFMCLRKRVPVKAAVAVAPLTNVVSMMKFRPQMEKLYGQQFTASEAEYIKRSVHYWVDELPKKVPVFLMHGTADWRTDPGETLELAKKFIQAKVPYRLTIFDGADHNISEYRATVIQNTIWWFDRFVKNKNPLPNLEQHGA